MALTFYWRCEDGALDATHDYSAGDTSATAVNSPSYSTTARMVGASGNGLLIDADERVTFDAASIIGNSAGCVGLWVTVGSSYTSDPQIFIDVEDAATNRCFTIATVGNLSGNAANVALYINRNGASPNDVTTNSNNLSDDTAYFVIAAWDDAANSRYVGIYNSSLSLIDDVEDTTTNWATGAGAPSLIKAGNSGGFRGFIDNVFIGSAYADKDTILANADIESYTAWSTGASIVPQAMANYRMRAA